MASIEKAEKVVKDPKTPIIKNYLIKDSAIPLLFKYPTNKPIKNEPIIFIKRVPNGKDG